MIGYLLRRALLALLLMFGAATLVFFLIHLVPGDPARMMLGPGASDAAADALRRDLGLDRPLAAQFGEFVVRLARGDLGRSFHDQDSVVSLLAERLPATARLGVAALALALLVALPVGTASAFRPGGSLDRASQAAAALSFALPTFWLGPMLVLLFSVRLRWLPVSGSEAPGSWILPAVTLGVSLAALLARLLHAGLSVEIASDYLAAARGRGASRLSAVTRHALRNAASPMLTALGLQIGSLLTGAILTETIFAWPGLGRLLVRAIATRDYPLVQGCVLLFALVYMAANLACDLARAAVDPRTSRP